MPYGSAIAPPKIKGFPGDPFHGGGLSGRPRAAAAAGRATRADAGQRRRFRWRRRTLEIRYPACARTRRLSTARSPPQAEGETAKDDLVEGREVLRTDELERQEMMAVRLDEARGFRRATWSPMPAWRSSSSTTRLR
jgi:hypothetical protein